MKRNRSTLAAKLVLASLLASQLASAELRTLETVGTLPLSKENTTGVVPRDAAIEQALREAVIRIAQEFLADRPLDDEDPLEPADGEEPTLLTLPGDEPLSEDEEAAFEAEREAELEKLDTVLGTKMVPYTSRFRVIEDRGRRPALFSDDPEVSEEYVVIVEVQIDVDRVRSRLVEAGMLDATTARVQANEVLLEVNGLSRYAAYLDFRNLLIENLGAHAAVPVEMSARRTVFDVSTEVSAVEFLEALLTATPPHIQIDPLHASGARLRVAVDWQPPAGDSEAGDEAAGRGGPADL